MTRRSRCWTLLHTTTNNNGHQLNPRLDILDSTAGTQPHANALVLPAWSCVFAARALHALSASLMLLPPPPFASARAFTHSTSCSNVNASAFRAPEASLLSLLSAFGFAPDPVDAADAGLLSAAFGEA